MDLGSVLCWPAGKRATVIVSHCEQRGIHTFGREVPSGVPVAFCHEGRLDEHERMVLYNAMKSGRTIEQAWILEVDPRFPPLGSRNPTIMDLGYNHDVLCGLGGFTSALSFLSFRTVSAVDWTSLATSAYALNHVAPVIKGDIGCPDTVYQMHVLQNEVRVQPLISAGVPCQPLSCQGYQQKGADERSATMPAVLRAALALGAAGLVLECVPEALTDHGTQAALQEYAKLTDSVIHQRVLHLHSCWPARRSRWFATVTPRQFEFTGFPDLPVISPAPALGDLFPLDPWPAWSLDEEEQLKWTSMEQQVYHDPAFGPVERRLNMFEPCPTALHSWGSALYPCPCGCRKQGLSAHMLRRKGLRGIEIKSGCWPYVSRHMHPRELQLILGFPPLEAILEDCRAQLVLFGNAVSPIHGLWIFSHLQCSLGFLESGLTPRDTLREYLSMILHQRDISWPSPEPGVASLQVQCKDVCTEVTFNTTQRVKDLITAESQLSDHTAIKVFCEGVELPEWAYLQQRCYQLIVQPAGTVTHRPVPVIVEHLGVRTLYLVPMGFSYHTLMNWVGIHDFLGLVDSDAASIDPHEVVQPWRTVVVWLDPDALDFELSLRLSGLGLVEPGKHGLQISRPWCCTGLWHLDQIACSDLLLSWTGLGFGALTCWLPWFSEAVLELWPCTMDDHLRTWLEPPNAQVFAIVWESWGWNLVKFDLTATKLQVVFFEPDQRASCVVSHLAFRVKNVSARLDYQEEHFLLRGFDETVGSLNRVFEMLDGALGLPPAVAAALKQTRAMRMKPTEREDVTCWPSPTLQNLRTGLTVKFVLDFARAIASSARVPVPQSQIKVVCLQEHRDFLTCELAAFSPELPPMWVFILVDHHWTLVKCSLQGRTLSIVQYDGLAQTPISRLAPLACALKRSWNADSVILSTTWDFPQHEADSCGTIALAHFAYHVGAISYEQATCFENLHASLAVCSHMAMFQGPVGFGADEAAVAGSLEQILPSKGVPNEAVKPRINAAIKVFGVKALQQATTAKNP